MAKPTRGPWTLTHVAGTNFSVQRFELRGMFGEHPNTYPIFQKDCSAIDGGTFCASPEDARLIAAAPEMYEALRAVEWVSENDGFDTQCPSCAADKEDGHFNGCALAAALAKADGPGPRETVREEPG